MTPAKIQWEQIKNNKKAKFSSGVWLHNNSSQFISFLITLLHLLLLSTKLLTKNKCFPSQFWKKQMAHDKCYEFHHNNKIFMWADTGCVMHILKRSSEVLMGNMTRLFLHVFAQPSHETLQLHTRGFHHSIRLLGSQTYSIFHLQCSCYIGRR